QSLGTAQLVIAGRADGEYETSARRFFAGLDANVRWIGEVSELDKWALLQDSDLLVLCSDSENFGVSVIEALAVGIPVVTTKTCPWEVAQQFGCGLWVDHEPEALAGAITTLLSDPVRARDMGQRGKIFARERYGWESIGKAMAGWYSALLE